MYSILSKCDERIVIVLYLISMRNAKNHSTNCPRAFFWHKHQQPTRASPANVYGKLFRTVVHPFQKFVEFEFLNVLIPSYRWESTYTTLQLSTGYAEGIAIRKEWYAVFASDKFATHCKNGPVGIYGTLFIQHLHSSFDRVEYDDVLAQDLNMRYVPY